MHSAMTWFVLLVAAFAVSEADIIRERRNDETITVTTIEEEPYLKIDNSASGNDKFTGFIPDLMKKIAKEKNINYQFRLVGDKAYGFEENGRWNGMIGELIDGTAHLAAAPLTLSEKRQKVVKFTEPFMDIGTAMLAKKPESGDPPVNSFKELSEQTDVKYGVVKSGFTMQFFEGSSDPVYSKIWQYMNSHRQTSMLNESNDVNCITELEDFPHVVLRRTVLRTALVSLNQIKYFGLKEPIPNEAFRWAAYTQFTHWIHRRLGKGVRRVVPSCAVKLIQDAYPSTDGEYTGFQMPE